MIRTCYNVERNRQSNMKKNFKEETRHEIRHGELPVHLWLSGFLARFWMEAERPAGHGHMAPTFRAISSSAVWAHKGADQIEKLQRTTAPLHLVRVQLSKNRNLFTSSVSPSPAAPSCAARINPNMHSGAVDASANRCWWKAFARRQRSAKVEHDQGCTTGGAETRWIWTGNGRMRRAWRWPSRIRGPPSPPCPTPCPCRIFGVLRTPAHRCEAF